MNENPAEIPDAAAGDGRTTGGVASRAMKLRWMDCGGIGLFTLIEIAGIAMLVVIVVRLVRLIGAG